MLARPHLRVMCHTCPKLICTTWQRPPSRQVSEGCEPQRIRCILVCKPCRGVESLFGALRKSIEPVRCLFKQLCKVFKPVRLSFETLYKPCRALRTSFRALWVLFRALRNSCKALRAPCSGPAITGFRGNNGKKAILIPAT